jgi:hypothetical protein
MRGRTAILVVAASAVWVLSSGRAAAGSATATAAVRLQVLAPVPLAATQGLNFGAITRPRNAKTSTVSLGAAGGVSVSGSGDAIQGGAVSPARFSIVGDPGLTYSTSQDLRFAQTGLNHVAATAPTPSAGVLGLIPASGLQEIRVGGAFDVAPATPIRAYTGALSVTLNYN